MDDMAVILRLLIEGQPHVVAVARQVVAGQVDQHDMLGVLLGVMQQSLRSSLIFIMVSRTEGCPGDRVDAGLTIIDLAMGLGR